MRIDMRSASLFVLIALGAFAGPAACGGDAADGEPDAALDADAAADGQADGAAEDGGADIDDMGGSDAMENTGRDPALDAPEVDGDATGQDADATGQDADATGQDADAWGPPPDPAAIYEHRVQDDPATPDAPYASEETTRFRPLAGLGEGDVVGLLVAGGFVFVSTASGLERLTAGAGAFELVALPAAGRPTALAEGAAGEILVAIDASVFELGDGEAELRFTVGAEIEALVAFEGGWVVATADAVLAVSSDGTAEAVAGLSDGPVRALAVSESSLYVGGDDGLWIVVDGVATGVIGEEAVRALDTCPGGELLVAAEGRLVVVEGDAVARVVEPGPGALPTDRLISVSCGADWWLIGHEVGATALRPDLSHIDHYQGGRWLLDDRVAAVALDGDSRWLAGPGGVTRVDLVPRTLDDKALHIQDLLDRFFWRTDGFVSAWGRTPEPWSFDGFSLSDDDNDGQWTQEMIGAWAFAYGATGDRFYCDEARRAVRNMLLQIDIPCVTFAEAGRDCGFITRSFVRDDEGAVFDNKATQDNWHLVEYEGRQYYWKDDTSSDEYAGHYFGYPLYFDLCADDEERAEIAAHAALAMDYVIDNDYVLIDLDGERTKHGIWNRAYVSSCVDGFMACEYEIELCAAACFGGGFVNGAEILGHLLATWHMTGSDRYLDEYRRLLIDERYGEAVVFSDALATFTNPAIENHVDHELAMLAFHSLIRYEPDPERRQQWIDALLDVYESEIDEENPFWASFVAGLTGVELDRAAALESLREYPRDLRYWGIDHSHRLDYLTRMERDRFGERQLGEWPPPFDEQPVRWWDSNPYRVSTEGDGRRLRGPMGYLIAHWASRYYGLLGAPTD